MDSAPDIWFRECGVGAVVEETEDTHRHGWPALNSKLGREFRWLDKDAGPERAIAMVRAVRKAVGPGVRLIADSNDGLKGEPQGLQRTCCGVYFPTTSTWNESGSTGGRIFFWPSLGSGAGPYSAASSRTW